MTIISLSRRLKPLMARYHITTPMFLGDADSSVCADKIRPPSFKGVLRFWWRALNWGRVYQACQQDKNKALKCLHREEGLLFGHGAGGEEHSTGCQAAFRIRIPNEDFSGNQVTSTGQQAINGIDYLLGQGLLFNKKKGTGRNKPGGYIDAGAAFTVKCYPSPRMTDQQAEQLEQALLCLGLLGGLGARSRKGLGNLSVQRLKGGQLSAPTSRQEYIATVKQLLITARIAGASDEPPFSAFSELTRIDISMAGSDAMDLLRSLNTELQMYRSWGKEGQVNGKEAERNFKKDHDWAYDVTDGKKPSELPDRMVFGLPHNYHLSSQPKGKNDVSLNYKGGDNIDKRRASPLFSHVHQFPDGNCLLVQTLLQAEFLSPGEKVHINNKVSHTHPEPDWRIIDKFMNRFSEEQGRETIHGQ